MALALIAHRYRRAEQPVIWFTSFLYTIRRSRCSSCWSGCQGLGLSSATAEVALVAYTLLILFRNILTGLRSVPAEVHDAAEGMGMSRRQMLLRVDLPLALPAIIAGLRIATVSTIALATIAALGQQRGARRPDSQRDQRQHVQDRADRRRGPRRVAGGRRRCAVGRDAAAADAVGAGRGRP